MLRTQWFSTVRPRAVHIDLRHRERAARRRRGRACTQGRAGSRYGTGSSFRQLPSPSWRRRFTDHVPAGQLASEVQAMSTQPEARDGCYAPVLK